MNRLRNDKVIVEFFEEDTEEDKDNFREVSGILVPKKPEEKGALRKCTIKQIGHLVNPKDIPVGSIAYVRPHQGDRIVPSGLEYLYRADDIIGHD